MDVEEEKNEEQEKKHCRICYYEEFCDEKDGPLLKFLSPCKCKGTSSYIHFNCLREWLGSKRMVQKPNLPPVQNQATTSEHYLTQLQNYLTTVGLSSTENFTDILNGLIPFTANPTTTGSQPQEQTEIILENNVKNHYFTNFCCDVCRENLPFVIITSKGDEYETVDIPRPDKEPYLLFERLSQGKDTKIFSIIKGVPGHQTKLVTKLSTNTSVNELFSWYLGKRTQQRYCYF